jgi:hypothetical protein
MSRRVYWLGVGLALVALGLAFTDWALGPQPGVTHANVKRIKTGMTLSEVKAVLGPHPYEDNPLALEELTRQRHELGIGGLVWRGTEGSALVWLDRKGRVISVVWDFTGAESPTSPLSRLRAWLGW